MKAQLNMVSALLPVVPNTLSGYSTAYYASVWIDTQRWYKPAVLRSAAEPKLKGEKKNWGQELKGLLSDLLIHETDTGGISKLLETRKHVSLS